MKKVTESLNYVCKPRLGTGSSGTIVYRGFFYEKQVAVKKLDAVNFKMVEREGTLLKLGENHENIVDYFCTHEDDEYFYIALEICDFDASKYFQRKDDPKPTELLEQLRSEFQVKDILKQTTEGIAYLHNIQIIHRDIKPQNILLKKTENGWKVKISDFGISKQLSPDNTSTILTQSINPQAFIAPEVLNKNKTSKASDIYSLGCFFYYMQSGGDSNLFKLHKNDEGLFEFQLDEKLARNFHETDEGSLSIDLISEMCISLQKYRISADMVLKHAYFWNFQKKLEFLRDFKSMLYSEDSENITKVKDSLNFMTDIFDNNDWSKKLDDSLVKDIENKKRLFKMDCVTDLVVYIQKKYDHAKETSSGLKTIFGDSDESFLKYWTGIFPLLLAHIFLVCIARVKNIKDKSFTTKYLSFKSSFEKADLDKNLICRNSNSQPLDFKQMLHTNNSVCVFENYSLTFEYILKVFKAFSCSILHFQNTILQDKATFSQLNDVNEPFSYLKEIVIRNSDSCIELLSQTKSLECVKYEMVQATEEDLKSFIEFLCQQSRLTTLVCPGGLTKLLYLNKIPFQLNELSMVAQYNEFISRDLPQGILSFIKTQKKLQTLEISLPRNFVNAHVKELFGLLNKVKRLAVFFFSNFQDLLSYFKSCTLHQLEMLSLGFNEVPLDLKHFELVMKQFPKLKQFECSDNRGFLYTKDFSVLEDTKIKDIESFWFSIPTSLAIENIRMKQLETCKVAINSCNNMPAAFKTFIMHNSNVTNFEIQYTNSLPPMHGISIPHKYCDHVIVEMIDVVLEGLKELKTITVLSVLPIQNKEYFDKSIEKCKKQKNLLKVSYFEKLIDKAQLRHVQSISIEFQSQTSN